MARAGRRCSSKDGVPAGARKVWVGGGDNNGRSDYVVDVRLEKGGGPGECNQRNLRLSRGVVVARWWPRVFGTVWQRWMQNPLV